MFFVASLIWPCPSVGSFNFPTKLIKFSWFPIVFFIFFFISFLSYCNLGDTWWKHDKSQSQEVKKLWHISLFEPQVKSILPNFFWHQHQFPSHKRKAKNKGKQKNNMVRKIWKSWPKKLNISGSWMAVGLLMPWPTKV